MGSAAAGSTPSPGNHHASGSWDDPATRVRSDNCAAGSCSRAGGSLSKRARDSSAARPGGGLDGCTAGHSSSSAGGIGQRRGTKRGRARCERDACGSGFACVETGGAYAARQCCGSGAV